MPTAVDAVLGALPADSAGVGMAITTSLRMVAGAIGVALLPSLLSSVYRDRVAAAAGAIPGLPDAAARAATESVAGAAGVADRLGAAGAGLRAAAYGAFTDGMSLVLLLGAATAVLAAVLVGLFLPRTPAAPTPPPAERVPVPA